MEPILVPAPPKSSFNKNRRVSDLLLGQLRHFQHVEKKNGIAIDAALARDIQTEAGAARYITQITRAIRSQASAQPAVVIPIRASKKKAPLRPIADTGLTIAAAATSDAPADSSPIDQPSPRDRAVNQSKLKSKKQHKGKHS